MGLPKEAKRFEAVKAKAVSEASMLVRWKLIGEVRELVISSARLQSISPPQAGMVLLTVHCSSRESPKSKKP